MEIRESESNLNLQMFSGIGQSTLFQASLWTIVLCLLSWHLRTPPQVNQGRWTVTVLTGRAYF